MWLTCWTQLYLLDASSYVCWAGRELGLRGWSSMWLIKLCGSESWKRSSNQKGNCLIAELPVLAVTHFWLTTESMRIIRLIVLQGLVITTGPSPSPGHQSGLKPNTMNHSLIKLNPCGIFVGNRTVFFFFSFFLFNLHGKQSSWEMQSAQSLYKQQLRVSIKRPWQQVSQSVNNQTRLFFIVHFVFLYIY